MSSPRTFRPTLLVILCLLLRCQCVSVEAQQSIPVSLAFDTTHKDLIVQFGQINVSLSYSVTNLAATNVVIQNVTTSCGCSLATMPEKPWTLKPGAHGRIEVTTDLSGKRGVLVKSVILYTSSGLKVLTFKVTILEPLNPLERGRNQEMAKLDRQAVFKGECAKCHAEPSRGKLGKELFIAACSICHEAEHRASMVPDLRVLNKPHTDAYWLQHITHGKPGTLMPGFAVKEGGPLSEAQIRSLVEFLTVKDGRNHCADEPQQTQADTTNHLITTSNL